MANGFHWQLDGLDRQRFSALVNLLSIRQRRQVDLLPLDEDAQPFSGDRKLKMRFLDRFAELVSCEPGSEHVSCAMLRESESGVEVWVARNDGISRYADTVFFLQFEGLMSEVRHSDEARNDLWTTILRYYRPRLIHYIQKLKDTDPSLHSTLSSIHQQESRRSTWTDDAFSDIVDQAVSLTLQHGENGRQLSSAGWKYVEFIARVRRAHHTFIKCAKKFHKFRFLRIVPIQNEVRSSLPDAPWNLDAVLDYVGLSSTNWTASAYIAPTGRSVGHRSSIEWARNRFDSQNTADLFVHAEVRMILRILQLAVPMEQFFNYMGCSKDNCFMCSTFLKQFGGLTTRGGHSYVYNLWTIPDTPGLSTEAAGRLIDAIEGMESQMVEEIQRPTNSRHPSMISLETSVGKPSSGPSAVTEDTPPPLPQPFPPRHFVLSTVDEVDENVSSALPEPPLPAPIEHEALNDSYLSDRPPSPEPDINVEPSVVEGEENQRSSEESEGVDEDGCEEDEDEAAPDSPVTDSAAHQGKLKSSTPMEKLFPFANHSVSTNSDASSRRSGAPRSLVPVPNPSIHSVNLHRPLDSASTHSSGSSFQAPHSNGSVLSLPLLPWQRVHEYLADTVKVMPFTLFQKSLDQLNMTSTLDELALTIWSLQTYKRYLRSRDPDPHASPRPTRLFIPPNAAQAIESALLNGYQGSACEMLGRLWRMAGGNSTTAPEHIVILMRKSAHWVVHCMDLLFGRVVSFGTYYDSEWTKHQSRAWWPALQTLWSLNLTQPSHTSTEYHGTSLENRVLYHHQRDPPEGNSVAIASMWYKILVGIPVQRTIDLGRLKDLIRREVLCMAQRKQIGDLRGSE